jgi:CDP-paratose 2-epimerase
VRVLVTGSSGLVGSEVVSLYDAAGAEVWGIDNNQRAEYFGPAGDTTANLGKLRAATRQFTHLPLDVRERAAILDLFSQQRFDLIVHCAAQPSHDRARALPFVDFEVNALGTLHLLEAMRQHCPQAVFVLLSTNKVYGDAPNELPLYETATRYDYARPEDWHGISERCRIDQSLHSLFGVSKLAADLLAQEYARSFGLATVVLRCGCLTGAAHAGVELHGFLSYLIKRAVRGEPYTIFGYEGKQVRDNLHAHDVALAIEAVRRDPRPGAVYNLGGGRANSLSILEALVAVGERLGTPPPRHYLDAPRLGDHRCYISDLRRFQSDYPEWRITRDLRSILDEMIAAETRVLAEAR